MPKIYVLDTNVLLLDGNAINKFEENIVVIPQPVLNEIDKHKKDPDGEIRYNSRQFSRNVDELRKQGSLSNGVQLNDQGGMLYVTLFDDNVASLLPFQDMSYMDNRILACALYVQKNNFCELGEEVYEVVIVSNDTNMRILADIFGLQAEDYKNSKVQSDELYTGIQHIYVDQQCIDLMYTLGKFDLADAQPFLDDSHLGVSFNITDEYISYVPSPNECFVFHSLSNTKQSALTRYNSVMKEFRVLPQDMKTCDALPRSAEQAFALDILKDPEVCLVSLNAKAGCGKTFLALAAAIHGVMETHTYNKILLLKPIVPMDNSHELGFLPGGLDEKLGPWMASYADNIEQIMSKYIKEDGYDKGKKPKNKKEEKQQDDYFEKQQGKTSPIQEMIALGLLEFGSLEHARGRNWSNTYVIIDEGQNTSKSTMKTILTRIGEGSKIVVMGDPSQIDSPYLDSKSNGLVIVQDLFRSSDLAGHITLTKSERSKLAELAAELLN